ncbi:hypothetical protein D9611_014471 [Ephemerocybe angulata]|uniref:LysM domain-containing protein n=1 Tax=Ephemerocybe angulata TaxID=980116 RepID=A0A8H5FES0_9AGAR|nr:hypothetical protein D9611_014471 [Tulosesus angulatus]
MFASRSTLALASLAALFAQTVYAAECSRSYKVKAGDYCDAISAANNVSTYQLAANNPGTINPTCTNLQPDSTLCLSPSPSEDCTTTHIVVPNDTCTGILSAAQINGTIFHLNNPQVNDDCTNIYVGEVLCVGGEVRVPKDPGVPIHTAPPAGAELANGATATAPPAVKPTTTAVAATTSQAAPAVTAAPGEEDEEDCDEDDGDDIEVVDGPGNEDLPFCDELE